MRRLTCWDNWIWRSCRLCPTVNLEQDLHINQEVELQDLSSPQVSRQTLSGAVPSIVSHVPVQKTVQCTYNIEFDIIRYTI